MKNILRFLIFMATCTAINFSNAADYSQSGYEDASTINQDSVQDQWQEMRDQPALMEDSGIRDPLKEFFKLSGKKTKATIRTKVAKNKKGKKADGVDSASKEPVPAAESKIDGKPNLDGKPILDAKPKATESKAKSADGSTKSEY